MTWTILLLLPSHEVDESKDEGVAERKGERERGRAGKQLSKEVQNFMTN